jgi:hypothetical protein
VPARLGTIELREGRNATAPVREIPVLVTDLSLSARRSPEPQQPGDPTTFSFEVTNNGPNASEKIQVGLSSQQATLLLTPGTGSGHEQPERQGPG